MTRWYEIGDQTTSSKQCQCNLNQGDNSSCSVFSINIIDCLEEWVGNYNRQYNCLAKVKAVELRQKNRDDLLAQIEQFKKELSQVDMLIIVCDSIAPCCSSYSGCPRKACSDQGCP